MKLTCIICPQGCNIDIKEKYNKIIHISGYSCSRGKTFAETEFYNPQRIVTTIVSLEGGEHPFLPVISKGEVPKEIIKDCIQLLKSTRVKAPVKMGEIIEENILNTGVNIMAAKTVKMEER